MMLYKENALLHILLVLSGRIVKSGLFNAKYSTTPYNVTEISTDRCSYKYHNEIDE